MPGSWLAIFSVRRRRRLTHAQSVAPVFAGRRVNGHKLQDRVSLACDRPRHVRQRLGPPQEYFGDFSRRHALDEQLGADKSQGADFPRDVQKIVSGFTLPYLVTICHGCGLLLMRVLTIYGALSWQLKEEMSMYDKARFTEMLELTTEIVAAHVGNNPISSVELPNLIQSVYRTLVSVGSSPVTTERPKPAVPIKRSVYPDYIVCLEDGKKLKMLKRHLKTAYDMTPEDYRERWGLSQDYPMVAPNYAKHRSNLAKEIGLGTSRRSQSGKGA
jgi:predicted transcriptional regulator